MCNARNVMSIVAVLFAMSMQTWASSPQLISITDINNPHDLNMGDKYGYGRVEQPYRIAEREVSNSQYVAFLNAVAASDPFELYNEQMGSHPRGGIERHGKPGEYTYTVKPALAEQPVVFVSLLSATRYCNWLSCEQTETGVYTITTDKRFDDVFTEPAMGDLNRLDQPTLYHLPDRDQWYKAGYYDPKTQTYRRITDDNVHAPSSYGTLHQTDLAREWLETPFRKYHRAIGASPDHDDTDARNAKDWYPATADENQGFRLAATPVLQLIRTVNDQHNYFLDGNNTGRLQLRYDGQPTEAQLQWTLKDYFGNPLQNKAQTLTLKPGRQTAATFTMPHVDGYYEMHVQIKRNGQMHNFNPLPMVVADGPVDRPADLQTTSFGVTGHLGKFRYDYTTFADPAITLNLYRYAGITVNRMDGPWELVIDQTHKTGVRNLIVLSPIGWSYETWKSAANQQVLDTWVKQGIAPEFAGYAQYVFEKATQFKDQVDAWELTNEPWGKKFTPEDYAQSAKVAAKVLRMVTADTPVLLGDTTFTGKAVLATGAGAQCDIASFHVYSFFREYFWGIPTRLRNIRKLMDHYGMAGKPIWLTETSGCGYGMHIYPGKDRTQVRHYQALDLPKKMLGSLAVGADKTFFYNFRDTPAHGVENEFGMVHTDLLPKPAFAAYRTVAKHFTTSEYVGQIELPETFAGYLFRKDGKQQAIIWRRDTQSMELGSTPPPLPVIHPMQTFTFPATGDITQINLMGQSQPLPVRDNHVSMMVNEYPIYITGDVQFPMSLLATDRTTATAWPIAQANVRIMPTMPVTRSMRDLEKPSLLTAAWGQDAALTVRLYNQSDKPIRGIVSLQTPESWLPDAWHVITEPAQVQIPAQGCVTQTLGYRPPKANPVGQTQFLLTATLMLDDGQSFSDSAIVNIEKSHPYAQWRLPDGKQSKGVTFENKLEKGEADARLSWEADRNSWTEIYVYPSPKLAEHSLDELKPYALSLRSKMPGQITHLNLRLRDSSGEVFQYRLAVKLNADQWLDVFYDLPTLKPQATWGGNKDGKLDLPVMLQGIAFDFDRKVQEAGSLELKAR